MRKRRVDRIDQYESPVYQELQQRLAAGLKRIRAENDWTQERAAQECGMSTRLYQRCEAGDSNVTLTTLARICSGFQIDPADLWKR